MEETPESLVEMEAKQMINDAKTYLSSGHLTDFLTLKVKRLKKQDEEISTREALEILLDFSENLLDSKVKAV